MVTESLEQAVLAKESSQPQSSYEAAAMLTEFELKKILIDKMDKSESYLAAPEHRECYEGLIKSYDLDKAIFSTYSKVYSLKRSRKDKDKDEDPSAGSDRGLKKRKTSNDAEPTKEEPKFEVADSDMPQDQEENPGNDDEEPKEKVKVMRKHRYGYLQEIVVRRADNNLYRFKEGNFPRLRINDIEDMLLLVVHKSAYKSQATTFPTFGNSIKNVHQNLGYSEASFIYQNKDKKNRLMRIDELHKFSDGTLNDVRSALDDILKQIRIGYLPQTVWRKSDTQVITVKMEIMLEPTSNKLMSALRRSDNENMLSRSSRIQRILKDGGEGLFKIKGYEWMNGERPEGLEGINNSSTCLGFHDARGVEVRLTVEIFGVVPITIPVKESDELIKSSVEDLVPIPSKFEDTSGSDSKCILRSCDDFSPINVYKEKSVTFSNLIFESNDDFTSSDDESLSDKDVPEDNMKIYSNPLFEFDDEYISSDVDPLFDEVLEDIECKDSYDSNLDESTFLVTPLSDSNEDEFFAPVDDIEFLLHRDPSTPTISIVSILEGFTDELPLEENDDLFDLESKMNDWKKILYNAPIDDLMTKDKIFDPGGDIDEIDAFLDVDISTDIKDGYHDSEGDIIYLESLLNNDTIPYLPPEVFLDHDPKSLSDNNNIKSIVKIFDPGIHEKNSSPTYVSLTFEDRHYLFFTYVIRIFLPYFTYSADTFLPLSSRSEDIIFDTGISAFHFSSLKPVAYEFPMEVCSSTCFIPNITMVCSDFEGSRARGFVHCSLNLQSLA
ncbi:hypothetical protein Tco_0374112 [Tanacetum coccineum]